MHMNTDIIIIAVLKEMVVLRFQLKCKFALFNAFRVHVNYICG